jgi:hypothetical protein
MTFDCRHCRRPKETPGLPTVAEDGHTWLNPSEVLEVYNARRYEHYLRDFASEDELRQHLLSRAAYWALDGSLTDPNAIEATLAWWLRAHRRQVEARSRQDQLPA